MGGMIFDPSIGKGVKRGSIGHPNPRKVEIPRQSTMVDVSLEMYVDITLSDVRLADSDGIMVELPDQTCSLENYFTSNQYKPSKHKLYVMIKKKVSIMFVVNKTMLAICLQEPSFH